MLEAQKERDFSQALKTQEDRFVQSLCSDAKGMSNGTRAQGTRRTAVSEKPSQEEIPQSHQTESTAGVMGLPQERRARDTVGGRLSCHCIVYYCIL